MDNNSYVQALISLAVALWAAHTSITSGFRYINEIRDSIMCKGDGKRVFSKDHCLLMLNNDWLPLTCGLSLVTFLFFLIIWFIPNLIDTNKPGHNIIYILCRLSSAVPLGVSLGNALFAVRDYKAMKKSIYAPTIERP